MKIRKAIAEYAEAVRDTDYVDDAHLRALDKLLVTVCDVAVETALTFVSQGALRVPPTEPIVLDFNGEISDEDIAKFRAVWQQARVGSVDHPIVVLPSWDLRGQRVRATRRMGADPALDDNVWGQIEGMVVGQEAAHLTLIDNGGVCRRVWIADCEFPLADDDDKNARSTAQFSGNGIVYDARNAWGEDGVSWARFKDGVVTDRGPLTGRRSLIDYVGDDSRLFGWGEPAPATNQLALAMCYDACANDERALAVHLEFAATILVDKSPISFTMSQCEVLQCMVDLESA